MYDAVDDPYTYPGTTVLKNKLDLQESQQLDAFEAEISTQRATEPLPEGELDFAHYCAIHHHLFQDVYVWAGKPRTVRIAKGGNPFCFPEHIHGEATKLFDQLKFDDYYQNLQSENFASNAAHFLAELNAIHAFREGNGRAQLTFFAMLADAAGHPVDFERLDPQGMLDAMIASFNGSEDLLKLVIFDLIK